MIHSSESSLDTQLSLVDQEMGGICLSLWLWEWLLSSRLKLLVPL